MFNVCTNKMKIKKMLNKVKTIIKCMLHGTNTQQITPYKDLV